MTEETKEVKKMCWLAKLSMFCLFGVYFIVVAGILFSNFLSDAVSLMLSIAVLPLMVLWLISAIASLIRIRLKPEIFRGTRTSIISLVVFSLFLTTIIVSLRNPGLDLSDRVVCGNNLKGLGTSILIYAYDHDGMLPDGNKNWCDTLIMEIDGDPKAFMCEDSGAVYGESSYALNKNVLGKKIGSMGSSVVMLFETSLGRGDTERTGDVKDRKSFGKFPKKGKFFSGDEKVYLDRWNQVGGPEDLTVDNHDGKGCNVLFGDGHVDWIKAEDIGKLRWTAE